MYSNKILLNISIITKLFFSVYVSNKKNIQ